MNRSWLVWASLMTVLIARENPFIPSTKDTMTLEPATNLQENRVDFEQRSTKLPSSARVLKYVTFGYQVLDGSIEEKRVAIDERIDWHDSLIITKEGMLEAPVPMVPIESTVELPIKSEETVVMSTPPAPKATMPVVSPSTQEKMVFSFQDFIRFDVRDKEIIIETSDKNIRDFLIADPYKIVLDFERDAGFYTKKIEINQGAFKEITMGNHEGYYRAAILLDGHYRYKLRSTAKGLMLLLQ